MTLTAARFDLRMTAQCLRQQKQLVAEVGETVGASSHEAERAERLATLAEAVFESVVREYLRKLFS